MSKQKTTTVTVRLPIDLKSKVDRIVDEVSKSTMAPKPADAMLYGARVTRSSVIVSLIEMGLEVSAYKGSKKKR